jgi:glycosyltransferase involved in cell wall biosynthesis
MGSIRIEGDPAAELPREPYDAQRASGSGAKAICHAPFGALHVRADATIAPCRHSRATLGAADDASVAAAFDGDAARALRDRFLHYVVRRDECDACVRCWEDGVAAQSPALAEFDRALPPVNGQPPVLRTLSVDGDAALPEARVAELLALLPTLARVDVVGAAERPGALGTKLLDAVDELPVDHRPNVRWIAHGAIPAARTVPRCVREIEIELPLEAGGPSAPQRVALAALVAKVSCDGVVPIVRTEVGRSDWPELREWLAAVLACGAQPSVAPKAPDDPDSLAALDADLLAALHGVFYRWSVELGAASDDGRGRGSFAPLLRRMRAWQQRAAGRTAGAAWDGPPPGHALLQDDAEARHLLQDLLRVYHHPEVERWLARLAFDPGFVEWARARCAARLVALWLASVFERADAQPLLREIYHDAVAAARTLAADRATLAGGELARWHDDWLRALELEKRPRGAAPFVVSAVPAVPADPPRKRTRGPTALTVVIPSFNHERFVGAAIDSVLAQTGVDVHLLVVDDGSKDGTVEVARARARGDRRVTVRRNRTNLGLGESLWRALRSVHTPFVAVLNSDDVFHPARLEKCLAELERKPAAAVAASLMTPVDEEGRRCTTADTSPVFDGKRVHDWLRWYEANAVGGDGQDLFGRLLRGNFLITSSNLVARRDWLLAHAPRWRDLEYCVDWELFLAAAQEGRLRVVAEPLLAYRLHASNTVWFDEERTWRFYVESHRVLARALESLVSAGGDDATRFARVLEAAAGPLAENRDLDWAGVYLGLLLERLGVSSRAVRDEASRGGWKRLEQLRTLRRKADDVFRLLGGDAAALLRMRGEQPFLRSARSRLEVVDEELERVRRELESALRQRQDAEKLWHSAEIDRDREVADKARLYEMVGSLEGELDRERREGARRVAEAVDDLRAAEAALAQQRARANAEIGAEHARVAALFEKERAALMKAEERRQAELRAQLEREIESTREQSRRAGEEAVTLRGLLDQRTRERDLMRRTPEFRVGDLVVNRLKLKRPLRALEKRLHQAKAGAAVLRLRLERRGGGKPRVFATVCWNFPIYSQTFVYQELLQLGKRGFDLRLVYSKLDPKEQLHRQFEPLWKQKRAMHLDRAVHLQEYARYRERFPDRVEEVTRLLCEASGLPRERLVNHDNFLQGFGYARLAESWGAEYLHSYFFYDRSLMSLIASQVLKLPRGVTCYADHLLKDYDLKVVPLHLRTCDVVVATSRRIKRELLELAPDVPPDKILVKPNAIDCTRFPVLPRPEPVPGQPFRLVVTSRIEPKKGLVHLADAVKLLRDGGVDVECHVVGDSDRGVPASENCRAELWERIERHGLAGKFHLEGRQEEEGVRRFLAQAHLFVAPFVETESGDKDGIPTALVEALATGLPAVVTDAGSILEVVDDGVDARVVPQRDAKALAEAIRALLADPALRTRMAHAAAQKARERFDVAVCEPLLHERIRKILAAKR